MIYIMEPLGPVECRNRIKPGDLVMSVDRGVHEVEEIEPFSSRGQPDVKIRTKKGRTLFSGNVYSVLSMRD